MNAAVTAALIAAQQSEAADPVARLTKAKALNQATAIAIDNATPAEAKLIDQAIARGLIQHHADGRLSVNARAVEERNTAMGHQFLLVLLIVLSILASTVSLLAFAR
ncbi:MAG: hypothetical protein V4696_02300 [Pseudomonadota bacterium]